MNMLPLFYLAVAYCCGGSGYGYMGTDRMLNSPAEMAPDGLCLYHCLIAAADYASYMALTVPERAIRAEQLRQTTIAVLEEHGLSNQAARLRLSTQAVRIEELPPLKWGDTVYRSASFGHIDGERI